MADGAQPPHAARRGPPPMPRGEATPAPVNAVPDSPLEELLALVAAEAEATENKRRGADLRVRAALLAWDSLGDLQKALSYVEKTEHPIVASLRLAAALEQG